MGDVKKLYNAVVVDQELISQIWYTLDALGDPDVLSGSLDSFTELQENSKTLASVLAAKMAQQDCGLGDGVISFDSEALERWLSHVKTYLRIEENLA